MDEPKEKAEKTALQSYRLPMDQIRFIDKLVGLGILGSTKSAVMRALLDRGISDVIQNDFIKKYLESNELLDSLGKK